jgi:hypothetical protein
VKCQIRPEVDVRDKKDAVPVVLITSAPQSRFEQLDNRRRRYLISMAVRTVCLLLAIVVPYTPARILFVVAAIALPWMSVVGANGPLARDAGGPAAFRPEFRPALGPAPVEKLPHDRDSRA